MLRRLPLLIAITAGVVGFAGIVSAAVGPQTLVSGPSPFAACTIGGPGTNFVNAEVEPFLAVDPTDARHMIGVYQQDRWDNGGAHGIVAAVSQNGGTSWTQTWAHFSFCSGGTAANGGDFERASDPWVTFAPNGDAYQSTITLNGSDNTIGVLVSKLPHGSTTWSEPLTLERDTSPFASSDKESITADPTDSRYVYVVWDRARKPGENSSPNAGHSFAFRGDLVFSRTADSGATWSAPRNLLPTNANLFTSGNIVSVLPNGTLVDVFELGKGSGVQQSPNPFTESLMRSTDKGLTWSPVIDISTDQSVGVRDPDTGAPVRTGAGLPSVAVDPSNGTLYVVWADARFSGGVVDDIALSKSTDGGLTWSAPIKVNQTPVPVPAFTPAVAVASNGTVAVAYYDFRNNTPDINTLPTDYWIVDSTNHGATWGGEQRITPASFDLDTAPVAPASRGHFLGEYEGLAPNGNTFLPFFAQANTGNTANRTDIFFRTATP
jgi:hypothetical protein